MGSSTRINHKDRRYMTYDIWYMFSQVCVGQIFPIICPINFSKLFWYACRYIYMYMCIYMPSQVHLCRQIFPIFWINLLQFFGPIFFSKIVISILTSHGGALDRIERSSALDWNRTCARALDFVRSFDWVPSSRKSNARFRSKFDLRVPFNVLPSSGMLPQN